MVYRSRKGQPAIDLLLAGLVLFGFVIMGIVGYRLFGDINAPIQADATFDETAKSTLQQNYDKFPDWLDGTFMFILGMFWVAMIVSAFYVRTNPVFFFISVLLLTITFVIMMILSNTYEDLTGNADFQESADALPMVNWTMGHFLQVSIVMATTALIALFSRRGDSI